MTEREVEFTKKINKIQGLEDTESSRRLDTVMERNDKVRGGKVSDGKEASKRKKKEEKKVVSGQGGAARRPPGLDVAKGF